MSQPVRDDERALWAALAAAVRERRDGPLRLTPREAGRALGIPWNRVRYLCEKWANKGAYNWGVTVDMGWIEGDPGAPPWERRAPRAKVDPMTGPETEAAAQVERVEALQLALSSPWYVNRNYGPEHRQVVHRIAGELRAALNGAGPQAPDPSAPTLVPCEVHQESGPNSDCMECARASGTTDA